jgi:hypothetical protein
MATNALERKEEEEDNDDEFDLGVEEDGYTSQFKTNKVIYNIVSSNSPS